MTKLNNSHYPFLLLRDLHEELVTRKKNNQRYSLRAYARDLKIDVSLLSKLLRNKLPLSDTLAEKLCEALSTEESKKKIYMDDIKKVRNRKHQRFIHNFDASKLLPDDHLFAAILFMYNRRAITLHGTVDFTYNDIKNFLKITQKMFIEKLKRLEKIGLITLNSSNQIIFLDYKMFQISIDNVPESHKAELKKLTHLNMLEELRQAALNRHSGNSSPEHFAFTSYTFGIDSKLIEEFKTKLKQAADGIVAEFVDKSQSADICLTLLKSFYSVENHHTLPIKADS